ncbi:hypothetical protein AWC17_21590 [Mycobacterium nebraskense]|uniref:Uncharacterized protein n=1 Tax=Mycobacterium nebraskense TaxID=244292 RepID=A0A1X2A2D9_9MYCO|nr:hypothetical protein ABW17_28360 [Mycobacterium nebraskense]ORW35702.1 hypothetical protein AWC17_21590 [Mycobacterium nebraskense]
MPTNGDSILQAMVAGVLFELLLLTSIELVLYTTVQTRVWAVAPRFTCRKTPYNYLAPRRARAPGVTTDGLGPFIMDQDCAVVLL